MKESKNTFYWNDYKEDIIPFITYLYDKYNFDSKIEFHGVTYVGRKSKGSTSDIIEIAGPEFSFYKRNRLNLDKLEEIDIKYELFRIYLTKGKINYYN